MNEFETFSPNFDERNSGKMFYISLKGLWEVKKKLLQLIIMMV